jgi:uncharacterized protein YraI
MRPANFTLLVAALLAASAGAAAAQGMPALTTNDVNLRAGPTTNSPSFGIIPGGSTVQAGPCGGGWCQAFIGGRSGFIAQMYLDFGGPRAYAPGPYAPGTYVPGPPPPPPVVYGPPRVYGPPPYWVGPRW